MFGNPDYPTPHYWEEDPNLLQVVIGVLFAPSFIVGWALYKIATIKIKI